MAHQVLSAQDYPIHAADGDTVQVCSGNFYDSGSGTSDCGDITSDEAEAPFYKVPETGALYPIPDDHAE